MRGVIDKKIELVILSIRGMLEKAPACEILVKSKIKNIKAGIKIKKIIEVKTTFECICNFLALKRESIISDQTKKPIPPITIKNAIVANIPGLEICGKTGTAQNRGKDHSVFMGFSPKENPKIAVAVYVEHGGFGATWGVPIGAMIIEKYLNGYIDESRQYLYDYIKDFNLIPDEYKRKKEN